MNVLIVDDDMGMRLTLQRIMEGEGHRVVTAADGSQALLVAQAEPIDIAFVDFKMVGMNGGDTCAALHRARPAAALYVMTAHVSSEAAEAALDGGAAGILHKPLDLDQMLGLVEACAGGARQLAPQGGA